MRKELRKILKRRFTDSLVKNAGFSEMTTRSPYALPRDMVYRRTTERESVHLFVILVIVAKLEAFTLEVGWSTKARFPELPTRPSGIPTPNRIEFDQPEFTCRLGDLIGQPDRLWVVQRDIDPFTQLNIMSFGDDFIKFVKDKGKPIGSEDADSLVKPLVDDAITTLVSFGIPYLNEFVTRLAAK